ncbi:SCO3242 family prenyltransferase [Streptomyces sp. SH5]|uniref:SCO3242 family prenyltransferase n=1 Tax=Streptomyces sp. SH5 TaxID=3041765 RepID=UPI0024780ED5|nr:UbiA family prenyltransferase [Streptomyces sp. SH5]WGP13688.1 UbiA family prenyltransferase [Streptomyces sp. SH5]
MTHDSLSGAGGTAPAPDRPGPPATGRDGEGEGAGTDPGRPDAATGPGAGSGSGTGPGSGSGTGTGSNSGISSGTGPGAGSGIGSGPDIRSGTSPGAPRQRLRTWAELLRVSALFSVPGDALAGAAAVGRRPSRGTALAIGASLCLYEAGMALNDWADRDEDAIDRPQRPIPSGRISPAAALGAAGVLTAAGLALAARAGRPALTVATGLAATVWAYDLHLKHTKAGPAAMAAARSLNLLLGATATATAGGALYGRGSRDNVAGASAAARAKPAPGMPKAFPTAQPGLAALPAALVLGAHTYGVTAVSRHETQGGSTGTPLAVLATTTALAAAVLGESRVRSPGVGTAAHPGAASEGGALRRGVARPEASLAGAAAPGTSPGLAAGLASPLGRTVAASARLLPAALAAPPQPGVASRSGLPGWAADPARLVTLAVTGAYLRTAGPPLLHAALNPSPPLTQRAVGGGIRAMIPLQAALAARAGSPVTALAVMGLVPLARSLARKVSLT